MKNKKNITAVILILSIIMSFGMTGCGEDNGARTSESSKKNSTVPASTESKQEEPTSVQNSQSTSRTDTSSPAQQSSKAESSAKPKLKNEAEVKKLLSKIKNEKKLYDEIYKLDGYKAGGHVITDLDGDGSYELVIRSTDRTTISIYKAVDKVLKGPIELKASDQADLRYGFFSEDIKYCDNMCCFTTLEDMGGNTYVMDVYSFNGIDSELEKTRSVVYTASYVAEDLSSVQFTTDDPGFLEYSWQESFNDDCKSIITLKENEKKPDLKKTQKLLSDFASNYYKKDDLNMLIYSGVTLEGSTLPIGSLSDLAKNEVLAKHGAKFDHPLCIAFFNKMDKYEEKKPVSQYDLENYKNEKDLTDTDKNVLEALFEFDESL